MSLQELEARIQRAGEEAWCKGNVDALNEAYAADYISHKPPFPDTSGLEAVKQSIVGTRLAFSDIHATYAEWIAEGDAIAYRYTMHMKHTGVSQSLPFPPTGKEVTLQGCAVVHVKDGKVIEEWEYSDYLGFLQQLTERRVPELSISEVLSYEHYCHLAHDYQQSNLANRSFERSLIPDHCTEFALSGYCYVCRTYVDFLVDFEHAYEVDGALIPNWRERLVCPSCHLNNRMRAAVHVFNRVCQPNPGSSIYITEQTTATYGIIEHSFPNVSGSEYLGDAVDKGTCNSKGIRNEDLTQLSFDCDVFDYILSFDVFEHIPDYKEALAECCRCLKPGGMLLFSVPFGTTAKKNILRACVSGTGDVIHLLPPEYHGDPMSSDGCLCFHHFGWEILDELRAMGFGDVKALLYWSRELGYLGGEQILFVATKNPQPEQA